MADKKRQELIERLHGSLPRYPMSDDEKDQVVLSARDVALTVDYLKNG